MFNTIVLLACVTLATAWPAQFFSDANCNTVVASYDSMTPNACFQLNAPGLQSYKGSLGASNQQLQLYKTEANCTTQGVQLGNIEGVDQNCFAIAPHLLPVGAAKMVVL